VRGEQQVGFYYVFADYIYSVLEYDVVLIDGLSVFRISFLSLASGYANASTMLGRISSVLLFVNYPGDWGGMVLRIVSNRLPIQTA